jgi:hypothetical protein
MPSNDAWNVDLGSTPPTALAWTEWVPLDGSWRNPVIPSEQGLYRIRRLGRNDLDYIGQTGAGGMTLRKRLSMLKGVFGAEMPYRDPHTAGPALWALVREGGVLEVSVAPVTGSTPWRKGLEAVAIALYRQQHGHSPTVNFGRMPSSYRMSSANNARLVNAGKRFRGGRCSETLPCHAASVPPTGALVGAPQGEVWCGLRWSAWQPLTDGAKSVGAACGVYRIRGDDATTLLYVGQGVIAVRVMAHAAKMNDDTNQQGLVFASGKRLECSYVANDVWLDHQRLEVENDLIAAHVLVTGRVPDAQFIG